MSAVLLPVIKARFFDANGVPLANGKVYTYDAGTTTDKDTYTDSSGDPMSANTNPVILDAAGEADIWLDGMYHIVVTDENDVQLYDTDNVSAVDLNTHATETTYGLVRFATDAETLTGTADDLAVHPQGLKYATKVDNYDAKTAFVAADELLLGDSEDSFINKKITATDFEDQLKTDLTSWVNSLIAAAGTSTATGGTGGIIVDRRIVTYNSTAAINAAIPTDNTAPQITEGYEILSTAANPIIPKSANNFFRYYVSIEGRITGTGQIVVAVFDNNASTSAIRSSLMNNTESSLAIIDEFQPGVTVATPVSVRIGRSDTAGNFFLNCAQNSAVNMGNTIRCVLIVEEIDPSAGGGSGAGGAMSLISSGSIDTAVSSGLLDLSSLVADDAYTQIEVRLTNIVSTSTTGNLIVKFAADGSIESGSKYMSAGGAGGVTGSTGCAGNFNQAPQVILANSTSHVFAGGGGTIVMKNFCVSSATQAASIDTFLNAYSNNGGGASDLQQVQWNSVGIYKGAGAYNGLGFSASAGAYTFDYSVYGIT